MGGKFPTSQIDASVPIPAEPWRELHAKGRNKAEGTLIMSIIVGVKVFADTSTRLRV